MHYHQCHFAEDVIAELYASKHNQQGNNFINIFIDQLYKNLPHPKSQFQWLHGLRHVTLWTAQLLELWVQNLLVA
jgi:hypothetical protein